MLRTSETSKPMKSAVFVVFLDPETHLIPNLRAGVSLKGFNRHFLVSRNFLSHKNARFFLCTGRIYAVIAKNAFSDTFSRYSKSGFS